MIMCLVEKRHRKVLCIFLYKSKLYFLYTSTPIHKDIASLSCCRFFVKCLHQLIRFSGGNPFYLTTQFTINRRKECNFSYSLPCAIIIRSWINLPSQPLLLTRRKLRWMYDNVEWITHTHKQASKAYKSCHKNPSSERQLDLICVRIIKYMGFYPSSSPL